ncbi:penicillin-binding transpeptidase domain-containing protein [Thiofilum flexile]|uniref:penicillin-binding transpeptidase domain-containing protein n=1 Tax=Thiofilum flexile TaxID=125627 RepID=UPI0003675197|nr:penicillin-binding transpeptidase domain-containing protein [Thiofilum flexile]
MKTGYNISKQAGQLLLVWALLGSTVAAQEPTPADQYNSAKDCDYLASQAEQATFVLYLPTQEKWLVCNQARAEQPVLPASTFKIPHALIALETGVIEDEFKQEQSDGKTRAVPVWNQPTSLASGMTNSTVWFYQRLAERIGIQKEREWLQRLGYGNADMGKDTELTTFWLTGALRISALEQVRFIDRLRRHDLPASVANQNRVAAMMAGRISPDSDAVSKLHAKSGAVLPIGTDGDISKGVAAEQMLAGLDQVGWYVGWVDRSDEKGGDAVFALHLVMSTPDALAKRKALAAYMLQANGVATEKAE